MEITIRKVANGYIVRTEGEDPVEGFVTKEFIFTRKSQVIKFFRETFSAGDWFMGMIFVRDKSSKKRKPTKAQRELKEQWEAMLKKYETKPVSGNHEPLKAPHDHGIADLHQSRMEWYSLVRRRLFYLDNLPAPQN